MVMSWIYTVMVGFSLIAALVLDNGGLLAAAVSSGAQAGVTLAISVTGSICLWTGVGKLMERVGITRALAKLLRPLLHRVFPQTKKDAVLSASLSANICANFLGLGNAATPMGILSVRRMAGSEKPRVATNQMCRLVVLNTASIQLIPTTVAAVRAGLGCETPFDILPAVWMTSLCSAGLGVAAAWLLGRIWPNG